MGQTLHKKPIEELSHGVNDPSIGRFLSEDPIGFTAGDPNIFRYVGNNPVNFVDPWGLYVNEIYVGAEFPNPFGHSAIEINGKFYDVNKNENGIPIVSEYSPEEFYNRYGHRGFMSTPLNVPDEAAMQQFLDNLQGSEWDYNYFNNNCQTFVNESVSAGGGDACSVPVPSFCNSGPPVPVNWP